MVEAVEEGVMENTCIHCGRQFKASPGAHRKYCDRICRYAAQTGVSREEYIAEWQVKDDRQRCECHDCHKPTDGAYWCPDCRRKRQKRAVA